MRSESRVDVGISSASDVYKSSIDFRYQNTPDKQCKKVVEKTTAKNKIQTDKERQYKPNIPYPFTQQEQVIIIIIIRIIRKGKKEKKGKRSDRKEGEGEGKLKERCFPG